MQIEMLYFLRHACLINFYYSLCMRAVFYYITYDNVVIVDEAGYNSCRAPKGSITYRSGNDHIALARGPNYFICTNQDHCSLNGMKIAVNAI